MNILNKTKTYLVGPIEFKNERAWRQEITIKLKDIGIVCYDPYCKPFVIDVDETETANDSLKELRAKGDYDEVARVMRRIRNFDLALTDKADFIVAYIDPEVFTVGSIEEICWANRQKKPIFLIVEGGKEKCPLWLFGTIPHKYIYNNLDEVVEALKKIDSGDKFADSSRWRILREEFR